MMIHKYWFDLIILKELLYSLIMLPGLIRRNWNNFTICSSKSYQTVIRGALNVGSKEESLQSGKNAMFFIRKRLFDRAD